MAKRHCATPLNRSFRTADAAYETKADEARSILRRAES